MTPFLALLDDIPFTQEESTTIEEIMPVATFKAGARGYMLKEADMV